MAIRTVNLFVLALLFSAGGTLAGEGHQGAAGSSPGFERFKQLEGEWVAADNAGHAGDRLRAIFRVTSAGSAVQETMVPGSKHEMINMIHPEGDDIVLTHYCAMGNQPEMKAPDKIDGKDVVFKFVRAGNMKSLNESHMHSVTYTFVDKDTLRTRWTNYENGKPSGEMVFEMKRKK